MQTEKYVVIRSYTRVYSKKYFRNAEIRGFLLVLTNLGPLHIQCPAKVYNKIQKLQFYVLKIKIG